MSGRLDPDLRTVLALIAGVLAVVPVAYLVFYPGR
jgi:hypothetical protein